MRARSRVVSVCLPSALLMLASAARPACAQAWLPPKGQGSVAVLFTNVLSKEHFLPDRRYDRGRIDSNTLLFDVTYGISDRAAVTVGVPIVAARYRGNFPHTPVTLDDGRWHTQAQDFRFGLRYSAVRGPLRVTPFVGTEIPSHGYEFYAHSAPGRRLKELHVGVSAGRLFAERGLVVQGRYAFAFSEGAVDFTRRYSVASAETGYFVTPSFRLMGMASLRFGHTGIDLSPLGRGDLSPEVFRHHDRISRENYFNVSGGFAVTVHDSIDVFSSYTTTLWGRNTHAVNRGVSLGVSWSFGRSNPDQISRRNPREESVVRCICQKAAD